MKVVGLSSMGVLSSVHSNENFENKGEPVDEYRNRIIKIEKDHVQRFNMSGYAAPPMQTVRVGIIGLGNREPTYIHTIGALQNVQIKALAELRPEKAMQAKKMAQKYGHSPHIYTGDENVWKKLCEREYIDLVVITTHLGQCTQKWVSML